MYQYSLEWYINLFILAITKAEKGENIDQRVQNLIDTFTFILYQNVCRSLFEKDKLLFSFLLCTKVMLSQKILDPRELRFFLQGSTAMELEKPNPNANTTSQWLSDKAWSDILALSKFPVFTGFDDQFTRDIERWSMIFNSSTPEDDIRAWKGDSITSFQLLMILRSVRPDMVIPGVQTFVGEQMGTKFIEPPPFDLKACYDDSNCTTPLIFVLTPGADPMTELFRLAEELGFGGKKLVSISLGQGQGPLATKAISEACDKGSWVCLQNCHLCVSWMPTLEKITEELAPDTIHANFRLWLTSEPSAAFPQFVLQNGVKMTNEPPKGMRANLLGSYYSIEPDFFESCAKPREFKKMLFGLCFFHATVRERKKFGPLGWNIQYVFSGPDLRITMDQLKIFLDDMQPGDPVPYAALAYLAGECNYGGRVTDDKDRRCLVNILSDFYNPLIQDDTYKFSPSGIYYAPEFGDLESYRDYIRTLPHYNAPEVFGLHENANISFAIAETNLLLNTALSLQPKSTGGGEKSWDEILLETSADILSKVPEPFDIEKALLDFPVRYDESMNTVLTQELIRFNRLIITVLTSLKDLQKAIKGLVVMSGELEAMGNSMSIGKVPDMWGRVSYPSLKPLGGWVNDLLARLKFLQSWIDELVAPNVFWISGFFFTQAFITGTLQNFARKMQIPIDQAAFDFRVLTKSEEAEADTKKAEDGAFISGFFLEGCRWDREEHSILESKPRELYIAMPYMHLWARKKKDIEDPEGSPALYTGERW
ncbi:MAG: hypothetical protein CMJ88_12345 [Planctomycetes bacterium]|nr:hypothetical protein [Planctomycetota bacterium]